MFIIVANKDNHVNMLLKLYDYLKRLNKKSNSIIEICNDIVETLKLFI